MEEKNLNQRIFDGIKFLASYIQKKNSVENNRIGSLCAEINARDTFIKIKGDYFNIGKVRLSFVQFDKEKNNTRVADIDVCMNFSEWAALSHDIIFGRIFKLAEQERAKGEKYPKAVYESPLGGINEANCMKRKLRADGKAISRRFSIAPGSRQPFVITAEQRPGKSDDRGLIVPEGGRPEVAIRVPCTREALIGSVEIVNRHIEAFLCSKYNDKTSDFYYTPKQEK